MLTQEQLKSVLHYDPDTGVFTWLVRPSNRVKIGDTAGCLVEEGYVLIRIDDTLYKAHRLAWLYVYGALPTMGLDHKDRNRSNNAIANLRELSQAHNMQNVGLLKNNVSGVTGVFWNRKTGRWWAYIAVARKRKYLGFYDSKNDAIAARLSAEKQLHPYRSAA